MPKTKKIPLIPKHSHKNTVILALIAIFLGAILWHLSAKRLTDSTKLALRGTLKATVTIHNNPYPNYLVRIFKTGDVQIIASSLTDTQGNITLSLPTGNYIWISNEKDSPLNKTKPVEFSILPNQTTNVGFVIQ